MKTNDLRINNLRFYLLYLVIRTEILSLYLHDDIMEDSTHEAKITDWNFSYLTNESLNTPFSIDSK